MQRFAIGLDGLMHEEPTGEWVRFDGAAAPPSGQSDRIPRTPYYTRPSDPRFAELVRDTSNDPHLVAEAEKLLAAAPPEPPNLDCGRLARAIDEHIESDCPRDTACDGTCADSIAERYGGAAPDPSVEQMREALTTDPVLSSNFLVRDRIVAVLASLHEGTDR